MTDVFELMSYLRIDNKNLGHFSLHSKDHPLDSKRCKGEVSTPRVPFPHRILTDDNPKRQPFSFWRCSPLHQLAHPPIDPGTSFHSEACLAHAYEPLSKVVN
ncbi:hypothetical protein CDAR_441141 [Caerostris darwini]|uniref:Uncharacterized protein n=1 Tax=Caerostris darwini TaxID=1538125 RepID=A0AAV4Q6H9_9ARAC|nr:hypothetical protein CDAR_441141 [Caerostris darwini]